MRPSDPPDFAEAGRRLGHDLHCLSRIPPQADWPTCVREGFAEAGAAGHPRRPADRFERKWLQLRLGALRRDRVVAPDVTVALLRCLDVTHCPVTRVALTHGTQTDTDASIDRLNNDGAYAASNLAVLSVAANRAKGSLDFEAVLARAEATEPQGGLAPAEWLRLAALMEGPAFAGRQHLAPILPLCAPLPACSVRLALQQIQRLFTLQAARPAGKNALVRAFRPASRREASERRLGRLADAVHEGLKRLGPDEQCWDVWLQPRVMEAVKDWRKGLDETEWARAAAVSGQLAGGRRVTSASLQPWHLPSRGYRTDLSARAVPPRQQSWTLATM